MDCMLALLCTFNLRLEFGVGILRCHERVYEEKTLEIACWWHKYAVLKMRTLHVAT